MTTVYILHDTLTPGSARKQWQMPLGSELPMVGDCIEFEDAGHMGAHVEWTVTRRKWLNAHTVELTMTGPTGKLDQEVCDGEVVANYTTNDNGETSGVHLQCGKCEWTRPLGFDPSMRYVWHEVVKR